MTCKIPMICGLYSVHEFALKLLVKLKEGELPLSRVTLE